MAVARRRERNRTAPRIRPRPADSGLAEGRAVSIGEDGLASVELASGRMVRARLPQHVSAGWLRAALEVAPVEAMVALYESRAVLWCVFPGLEHDSVRAPIALSGSRIEIQATESLELRCGPGSASLDRKGRVRVRGKEILSRASGIHRIKGGAIRFN